VGSEVTLSRPHLVDPSRNKFPKTLEGVREQRGRVGVVWGGWGSGPVGMKVLSCPHLESHIGWIDRGDGREVVAQVKGDGGYGGGVLDEEGSHVR